MSDPRVIIVGNGTSLRGAGLGEDIDKFPVVVRLNKFVIEPDTTGAKVTVHLYLQGVKPSPDAEIPLMTSMPWDYGRLPTGVPKLPWDIMERAHGYLGTEKPVWPSTGFAAIFNYVVDLNGKPFSRPGIPVAIVGFDHGKTGHYWNPAHVHVTNHDWEKEAEVILSWEKEGLVTRLDG